MKSTEERRKHDSVRSVHGVEESSGNGTKPRFSEINFFAGYIGVSFTHCGFFITTVYDAFRRHVGGDLTQ